MWKPCKGSSVHEVLQVGGVMYTLKEGTQDIIVPRGEVQFRNQEFWVFWEFSIKDSATERRINYLFVQ
jgi:hypothetical protein